MKILLFGEFSGLFNCLKDGLIELGNDVTLVSDGNGYKNYPSDFRYDAYFFDKCGKLATPLKYVNLWVHKHWLRGYDIVCFMDPSIVSRHVSWNASLYRYMIRNNKKSFLCGAGDTAIMVEYWLNSNKKYHKYVQGIIDFGKVHGIVDLSSNPQLKAWENELLNSVNGYIPIWYEYAQPFRHYSTLKKTIRIPIPCKNIEYKPNRVKNKIVFFHGVPSRQQAKGTYYIKEAFNLMQKKYGDVAEFVCAGGLPFNKYIDLLSRANVILDDVNSYSIAMNGLFSLAKGKIVMGGAEPEGNMELGINGVNPVLNLTSNIDQICSQIEYIIKHKDKIEEWGFASRLFVEKYHNHIEIAREYEEIFKQS